MKRATRPDHRLLAEALRRRVLDGPGETDPTVRQGVAATAMGGAPPRDPCEGLARQIGEAACRCTDVHIANVIRATGSEKAAFEVILAAAVGASLFRWQRAIEAVEEATDAPA